MLVTVKIRFVLLYVVVGFMDKYKLLPMPFGYKNSPQINTSQTLSIRINEMNMGYVTILSIEGRHVGSKCTSADVRVERSQWRMVYESEIKENILLVY